MTSIDTELVLVALAAMLSPVTGGIVGRVGGACSRTRADSASAHARTRVARAEREDDRRLILLLLAAILMRNGIAGLTG